MLYPKQYSFGITAVKGVSTATLTVLALYLVNAITTGDWTLPEDVKTTVAGLVTAGLLGLYAALRNALKNKFGIDLGAWAGLIAVVVFLGSSCASMTPAIGGKTKIETSFHDTVAPDGTQTTNYQQKLEAPAGVEAKDLASMTYQWDQTGSGAIAVSSAPNANTLAQGEVLKSAMEADDRRIDMLLQAILGLGNLASPLISQNIAGDDAARAMELQNKAMLQQLIADAVQQALKQQRPARPERPVNPPIVPVIPESPEPDAPRLPVE